MMGDLGVSGQLAIIGSGISVFILATILAVVVIIVTIKRKNKNKCKHHIYYNNTTTSAGTEEKGNCPSDGVPVYQEIAQHDAKSVTPCTTVKAASNNQQADEEYEDVTTSPAYLQLQEPEGQHQDPGGQYQEPEGQYQETEGQYQEPEGQYQDVKYDASQAEYTGLETHYQTPNNYTKLNYPPVKQGSVYENNIY